VSSASAEVSAPRRFLPRWAMYLLLPGLVGPLLILGFIFVSELAHDEGRCPYAQVELRQLSAAVSVREDRRRCLGSVEERRFTAVRGAQERTLGRRRFDAAAFAAGSYRWAAALSSEGEVKVEVHNRDHSDAVFREGTPEERASGTPPR
jgi:hypothetical protein